MSLFTTVIQKAKSGELPAFADLGYYASPAFQERAMLSGPEAPKDKVAILLHLLSKVALDPRVTAPIISDLQRGTVILTFFGMTNPVPWLLLPPASPEVAQLKVAIENNLSGPLNKAVRRILKWRTLERALKRSAAEDTMVNAFRSSLPWATPEEYKTSREAADATDTALAESVRKKREALRDLRLRRLSYLSEATYPDRRSWYDLLEDVALHALTPVH